MRLLSSSVPPILKWINLFRKLNLYKIIFQSLARLLYQAARNDAYVDPDKIEEILGVTLENVPVSSVDIQRLAAAISYKKMKSMAVKYFNMNQETLDNIEKSTSDVEDFNRGVLEQWANKNPKNQIKVKIVL